MEQWDIIVVGAGAAAGASADLRAAMYEYNCQRVSMSCCACSK